MCGAGITVKFSLEAQKIISSNFMTLGTTHKGLNKTDRSDVGGGGRTRKYSSGKKATLTNKVDFYFTLVVY